MSYKLKSVLVLKHETGTTDSKILSTRLHILDNDYYLDNLSNLQVNMKSPATSDEDSEVESTPLLSCSNHPSKHHSSLSAPHLSSDKHTSSSSHLSDKHRRVDFASTDIEIPDLDR